MEIFWNFSEKSLKNIRKFTNSSLNPIFFQEDVESWLTKEKLSIEEAEVVLREKYGKYKYVESSMLAQKVRMSEKIPEFENSLSIIDTLIAKRAADESFETTFLLSDDVYTKATVQKPEKVEKTLKIQEK